MLTERDTILEALEEIKTGMWDLVIMEDLSKPYRNPEYQIAFVHTCVDHDTRLISVGDVSTRPTRTGKSHSSWRWHGIACMSLTQSVGSNGLLRIHFIKAA